jgi:hypothetical protein
MVSVYANCCIWSCDALFVLISTDLDMLLFKYFDLLDKVRASKEFEDLFDKLPLFTRLSVHRAQLS